MCAVKRGNDLALALRPFRYQVWKWDIHDCEAKLDLNEIADHRFDFSTLIFILSIKEIRACVD